MEKCCWTGFAVEVKTGVANLNLDTETLDLSVCVNETVLQTMEVTLGGTNSTTLSITWNTGDYVKGRYAVRAYVLPVSGETEIDDNSLIGGWVLVTIVGDVNEDFRVNILDTIMIARSDGSNEGGLVYNPVCDTNSDWRTDLLAIVIAVGNYRRADS